MSGYKILQCFLIYIKNTFCKGVFVFFLGTILVWTQTAYATPQKFRIGTEGAYPPMNFVDKNGQPQGFEVDLIQAMCRQMHATCDIVIQDWDGLIPALLSKKIDVIASSLSSTSDREKIVAFSSPYFFARPVFVVKKSSREAFEHALSEELKSYNIGVQRGTVFGPFLTQKFPQATVELYAGYEEAFLDLKTGRIEAVLGEDMVCSNFLRKAGPKEFSLVPMPKHSSLKSVGFGFAFRKNDHVSKEAFEHALETIKHNGRYDELLAKWNMSLNQKHP